MRKVILGMTALAIVSFALGAATKKAPRDETRRPGFKYGGAPEFDSPPLPKDDREKQALSHLEEIFRRNRAKEQQEEKEVMFTLALLTCLAADGRNPRLVVAMD
jgi:hypothetical protein